MVILGLLAVALTLSHRGATWFDANDVWEMGTSMQASRRNHSLLPVAGGMIAVGGDMGGLAEVYDEASRRWYALPGSSHLIGDNWCDDALEAEKFGMEVVSSAKLITQPSA